MYGAFDKAPFISFGRRLVWKSFWCEEWFWSLDLFGIFFFRCLSFQYPGIRVSWYSRFWSGLRGGNEGFCFLGWRRTRRTTAAVDNEMIFFGLVEHYQRPRNSRIPNFCAFRVVSLRASRRSKEFNELPTRLSRALQTCGRPHENQAQTFINNPLFRIGIFKIPKALLESQHDALPG